VTGYTRVLQNIVRCSVRSRGINTQKILKYCLKHLKCPSKNCGYFCPTIGNTYVVHRDAVQLLGIRRKTAENRDEWRRLMREAKAQKGV
jgi:IS1 family transposase